LSRLLAANRCPLRRKTLQTIKPLSLSDRALGAVGFGPMLATSPCRDGQEFGTT
jgi:hypothetical protein